MKYAKILETLSSEPLLITPAARGALLQLFKDHATMSEADWYDRVERMEREGTGSCGEKVEVAQMEIEDGIATIPIGGPIGMRLGSFEKGAGAVDVEDIRTEIEEAEENPDVKSILLDFDSPGGMVSGTPELADMISAVEKPVYAFTNGGMIASAAYWLASAADGIFATKSADIGSIGVYAPVTDLSEMAKQRGIKVKVFSSGTFKGMGVPGTSMTVEQEKFMQNRVEEIAKMFYAHVRNNRSDVQDEDMQGQFYKADQALARGFIDDIVADRNQMRAMLR